MRYLIIIVMLFSLSFAGNGTNMAVGMAVGMAVNNSNRSSNSLGYSDMLRLDVKDFVDKKGNKYTYIGSVINVNNFSIIHIFYSSSLKRSYFVKE